MGSGAPRMIIPLPSTSHLNKFLTDGWSMANTIRLGRDHQGHLCIDFMLEKPRPPLKTEGQTVGLDNNYKSGLVFSDGQWVAHRLYALIHSFGKREKQTHAQITSLMGRELKRIDFSTIKILVIEDLKWVRQQTRGKFPRGLNRRLSHWLYRYIIDVLARACEERGIRLVRKNPAYTSMTCSVCDKCDRRSRVGDRFKCRHCGFSCDADLNAARNLQRLGEAGVYGLRSLPSWRFV